MTAYVVGSGGKLQASWKLDGEWFMPLPLYPRKEGPWYPIHRLRKSRKQSADFGENKSAWSMLGMDLLFPSLQSCR